MPFATFEPWAPGYLDMRGEISLQNEYINLSGVGDPGKVSFQKAKALLSTHLADPSAWKFFLDNCEISNRLESVAEMIANSSPVGLTSEGIREFFVCKGYIGNALHGKLTFKNKIQGEQMWNSLVAKYRRLEDSTERASSSKNLLVYLCILDVSDAEPSERITELFTSARKRFGADYRIQFFYTYYLLRNVSVRQKDGSMKEIAKHDPAKYSEHLKSLVSKWPNQATPNYLLMNFYDRSDHGRAVQYAKTYLSLEKRAFRTSWIERAKGIAGK